MNDCGRNCFILAFLNILLVMFTGADCLLTCEWKSSNKIIALCPPREGTGDIIVATTSGGLGTCNVQVWTYSLKIFFFERKTHWNEQFAKALCWQLAPWDGVNNKTSDEFYTIIIFLKKSVNGWYSQNFLKLSYDHYLGGYALATHR
jgi:hypothetical protein